MRLYPAVLPLLFLTLPLPSGANPLDEVLPGIIDFRHELHANPELSNREVQTGKRIAKRLRRLGLDVQTGVAHTGVVATLRGGLPGPVVAVRADIDALPVTEQTDFAFRSTATTEFNGKKVGVAHACGHDIHMSVAMGTAEVLAAMRDELPGTVRFIFQPAEEGVPVGETGGAPLMIEEGVLRNPAPEAIYAIHSWPDYAVGQVDVTSGPAMASSDRILIDLHGKQSHGAWPHLGVDPIVLAAQVILGLQTIPSRSIDAREPAVVTVGIVRGGERFNIIPDTVHMEGTVRAFSDDVQDIVERRIGEILDGITTAAGASYDYTYERANPFVNNDPALAARARVVLQQTLGTENVLDGPPVMVAEDFAWFAREIPGFYFRLGVVAPGTESGSLHTPDFRADDSAIEPGIRAMTALVLDHLRNN
ncbi:MAG: amidohydrolase [Gammaproteobacteria bacterium]|nr:amidohydrolase [Gammaproteobacteria bacterium]NNF60822.1 amidohydrolase [Gammaproteobacteria bacterium]NNM20592.1 amidohydrolase [Gammaproteobacteria bacterium]